MSFREKHLWISIFSNLIVWSVYFRDLIDRSLNGWLLEPRFAGVMGLAFAGAVFVVALIEVVLTLIATLTTAKAERGARDEREIHAALKASHLSLMALIGLVFVAAAAAYLTALLTPTLGTRVAITPQNALVLLANGLVACIILAELARSGLTLAFLRGLR